MGGSLALLRSGLLEKQVSAVRSTGSLPWAWRKALYQQAAPIQVWMHPRRLQPSWVLYVKAVSAWLNLKINTFALGLTVSLTPQPSSLAKETGFQCVMLNYSKPVFVTALDNFISTVFLSQPTNDTPQHTHRCRHIYTTSHTYYHTHIYNMHIHTLTHTHMHVCTHIMKKSIQKETLHQKRKGKKKK